MGGLGLGSPEQMMSLMQNPFVQNMMQQFFSNPELMQQVQTHAAYSFCLFKACKIENIHSISSPDADVEFQSDGTANVKQQPSDETNAAKSRNVETLY